MERKHQKKLSGEEEIIKTTGHKFVDKIARGLKNVEIIHKNLVEKNKFLLAKEKIASILSRDALYT